MNAHVPPQQAAHRPEPPTIEADRAAWCASVASKAKALQAAGLLLECALMARDLEVAGRSIARAFDIADGLAEAMRAAFDYGTPPEPPNNRDAWMAGARVGFLGSDYPEVAGWAPERRVAFDDGVRQGRRDRAQHEKAAKDEL